MSQTLNAKYYEDESVQIVQLPYQGNKLSAFVILPKINIDEFIENFNGFSYLTIF